MQRFKCLACTVRLLFLQYNLAFQFLGKVGVLIFELLNQEFVIDENDTSIFGSRSLYLYLEFRGLPPFSLRVSFRHFFSCHKVLKEFTLQSHSIHTQLGFFKKVRASECNKDDCLCSVAFSECIRRYMQNRYAQVTCLTGQWRVVPFK